jgi:hypothetical protein
MPIIMGITFDRITLLGMGIGVSAAAVVALLGAGSYSSRRDATIGE